MSQRETLKNLKIIEESNKNKIYLLRTLKNNRYKIRSISLLVKINLKIGRIVDESNALMF